MMLSSTEAVSSAKAANIVNNLRNWKTATLEWYADHIDKVNDKGLVRDKADSNWVYITADTSCVQATDLTKYLNSEYTTQNINKGYSYGGSPVKDSSGLVYFIDYAGDDRNGVIWFIGCYFQHETKIKEKLESRASAAGLVHKTTNHTPYKANGSDNQIVFIEVMNFRNN